MIAELMVDDFQLAIAEWQFRLSRSSPTLMPSCIDARDFFLRVVSSIHEGVFADGEVPTVEDYLDFVRGLQASAVDMSQFSDAASQPGVGLMFAFLENLQQEVFVNAVFREARSHRVSGVK